MDRRLTLPLAALGLMFASGCAKKPELRVSDGWVRLSPVAGNPSAAYFTIHGGDVDTRLVDVSTTVAIRYELHESMGSGGMASMKPIGALAVPARSTIRFEPGGKHLMLWNINPGIVPGKTLPLVFTFATGERIQYDAPVQAAGAAAPAPGSG